jgi:hypothetical protein
VASPPPDFSDFTRAVADAVGADAVATIPCTFLPHAALRVRGSWQVLLQQRFSTVFWASLPYGPGFTVASAEDAARAAEALRDTIQATQPAPLSLCDGILALLPLGGDALRDTSFPDAPAPAEARVLFGGRAIALFQRRDGVRLRVEDAEERPTRVARTPAELAEAAAWATATLREVVAEQARRAPKPPLPPLGAVLDALRAGVRLSFGDCRVWATFYARDGVLCRASFDEGFAEDGPCDPEELAQWMSTAPDVVWRAIGRT